MNSFARIDRTNEFSSEIVFENVEITGNAIFSKEAKENVNLKELNETAAKISGENVVSGSLRFLENVTARRLNLNVLNGFEVEDFGDLIGKNLQNSGIRILHLSLLLISFIFWFVFFRKF